MSRHLEQALTGLIPSYNGLLPPELTALASSLLAQSRSRASSLKSEEEIARTYACAHLACERLKQRLNLPAIQPRPPVAPRTYKKVYSYFENALNGTGTTTPRKQQQEHQQKQREEGLEEVATPSKRRTPGTVGGGRATPRSRATEAKEHDEPPEWTMPLIRALCKAFAAPAAVPHVYSGLRSVLRLASSSSSLSSSTRSRPARETARAKSVAVDEIPALIAVLTLFVMTRMTGVATELAEHNARRDKAAAVIVDNGHADGRDEDELAQQIDAMVGRAAGQKWIDESREWWRNVGEGVGVGVSGEGDEETGRDVDGNDDGDIEMTDAPATVLSAERRRQRRRSSAAGGGAQNDNPLKQNRADSSSIRGGLGTMMQESVDYLSEEKKRDFKTWRAKIMKRVEAIEKEEMEEKRGKMRADAQIKA